MGPGDKTMDLDKQRSYWNQAAGQKTFTHPVNLGLLRQYLAPDARILDYGCGYGRICRELVDNGFRRVEGWDLAPAMIERGQHLFPVLDLKVIPESGIEPSSGSYDAVILAAVLTCIPSDKGQIALIEEIKALLKPGGLVYISDYLLQEDERNIERYQANQAEFGIYGVFHLPEGAVVRHHNLEWVKQLVSGFEPLDWAFPEVVTMNGHAAKAFQFLGRNGK
jgi:SAM-dependent methyltransferase